MIGTPSWFPRKVSAAAWSHEGQIWLIKESRDEGEHLCSFSSTGQLKQKIPVRPPEVILDRSSAYPTPGGRSPSLADAASLPRSPPFRLIARWGRVFYVIENSLACLERYDRFRFTEFEDVIHGIAGSAPWSRPRLAVSLVRGGSLLWPADRDIEPQSFARDMFAPLVTFTRGGLLVAVGEREGIVYDVTEKTVIHKKRFIIPGDRKKAIHVVRGAKLDEFAILTGDANVLVYSVER
jgi:hypothetical protein